MAENKLELTHLFGKKLDKPIIMKRKSETKKNKMEQVAALVGKKLYEEFNIYSEYRGTLKCKITDDGLSFYYDVYGRWWEDSGLLIELLKGEAMIIDG